MCITNHTCPPAGRPPVKPPGRVPVSSVRSSGPVIHPTVRMTVTKLLADACKTHGLDPDYDLWHSPSPLECGRHSPQPFPLLQQPKLIHAKLAPLPGSAQQFPSNDPLMNPPRPVVVGPLAAAGLRSLRLLPLLSDAKMSASQLSAPDDTQIGAVIDRYTEWRSATAAPTDSPFDTMGLSGAPIDSQSRKRAAREVKNIRDDCRRLLAWLSCILRSGGRLTWDVFTPCVQHWHLFANDCAKQVKPIQALADYATLLNKITAQLAVQVGVKHSLYTTLTANAGKPWHDKAFAAISASYKDARAAAKSTAAAEIAKGSTGPNLPPVTEHAALPVPVYQLEQWLKDAQTAMSGHIEALEALTSLRKSLSSIPAPVRRTTRGAPKRQKPDDPDVPKRKALAKQISDCEARAIAQGRLVGGYAVTFAQFIYMMRASSAAGGLELGGPGIASDLRFTETGLTYVIRFMKGWEPSDALHGERLPLSFKGAATVPWSPDSAAAVSPERVLMMEVIQYAIDNKNPGSAAALISVVDSQNPETGGSANINSHLHRIGATAQLEETDRVQNGRTHSISSHSIRKAAISMALASGVSAQNIRRWTRWHQAEMVWHYAQADYEVPDHWKSFFAWMKSLPAQTA